MGLLKNGLSLIAGLLAFAFVCGSISDARAQGANQPSNNPVAPTPSAPTTPSPQVGPSPSDAAAQPSFSDAAGQNLLAPPITNNRRPVTASPASTARNSSRNNNAFSPRLARAAPIMGDSFAPSLVFLDEFALHGNEVPQGGGSTRSKIAENSSSLPMDRFIFNYNHFHNAIEEGGVASTNVDRFTLGFEKTFYDQMMSVEVRMPFVTDNDFQVTDFTRNGSDAGNLSVTLKAVLTSDSDSLFAAGLTIDTPTGGGTELTINNLADPLTVDISNDAVHLSPFLGFLYAPGGGNTHQGFLQLDVPTNANAFAFSDGSGVATTELLEQTLLYVDYSFSKQLYHAGRRARSDHGIRRILGLAELHYTTTLEDSDVVFSGTTSNPTFEITSSGNRLDVVNLTLGVHTEFNNGSQLRLGTVAPITDDDDRFFDFEFQAQLNVPLR